MAWFAIRGLNWTFLGTLEPPFVKNNLQVLSYHHKNLKGREWCLAFLFSIATERRQHQTQRSPDFDLFQTAINTGGLLHL